jgi:L-ascorbate metabolism protein UlaG (beta-lactamase superfamily)
VLPDSTIAAFPAHFDGKRYFNPGAPQARGWPDVFRWKTTSRPERSPRFVPDVVPSQPPARVAGREVCVTLANHSTVLLQERGANILTDPVWSECAGPFGRIGPRRRRAPGVRFEDLPAIDIVLVSHNHYDHLDLPTLRRLARRGGSQFVAPLGVARLLQSQKINPVRELDWGQSLGLGPVTIHSVPALHFSGRGIFDRNRTLWCGYVMESAAGIVYFAADTAFGDHFACIRERFGPPRLALLPIGAYEPRWFMSPVHMAPDDAVRAHRILGARTSIAIHYGTFQLADEAIDTPRKQLEAYAPGDSFLAPPNGRTVRIEP